MNEQKRCEKCGIREFMADAFDFHWLGKDDCPMECEEKKGELNGEQSEEAEHL